MIERDASKALLRLRDGTSFEGAELSQLVPEEFKKYPLELLSYWVVGIPAPGFAVADRVDSQRGPAGFNQAGWQIQFLKHRPGLGTYLPTRLIITNGLDILDLKIRSWAMPPGQWR